MTLTKNTDVMNKMIQHIYKAMSWLLPWLCAVPLGSCSFDDGIVQSCDGTATLQLSITAREEGDLNTRADEVGTNGEYMHNLCVLIVDGSNVVTKKLLPNTDDEFVGNTAALQGNLKSWVSDPFTLPEGTYTVYAFANIDTYYDNYNKYITLPDYIENKAEKGLIGAAHFSDILRICLLAQYGGIWLDATIYCKQKIPEDYFAKEFFTCKSEPSDVGCISKNQWTTFCLGGTKNCILFQILKNFFFQYWKNEDCAVDYLFFDDAIEVARECIPEINYLIESVPYNNTDRDRLILRFADPWKKGCVDDLFEGNTILFKLGYREKQFLNEFTSKGEPTVYAAFLKDFEVGGNI